MKGRAFKLLLVVIFGVTLTVSILFAAGTKEKEKPTLSILCFGDFYALDETVIPFEEKYNCKVNRAYAGSNEELFAKTKASPGTYNIITITSARVPMFFDEGLIQDIDVSRIKNYNKLENIFRIGLVSELEPGKNFFIAKAWGMQTFVVNKDKIGDKIKPYLSDIGGGKQSLSYEAFKNPDFKKLTYIFDEAQTVCNMSAIAAGVKDPFNLNEDGYATMIKELTAWAKNCRSFPGAFDAEISLLTSEDAYLGLTGNNVLLATSLEEQGLGETFEHYLPTEGTILWVDGWIITKSTSGESLDLAYEYINNDISDESQTLMSEKVGWGVVNPKGSVGLPEAVKIRTWWYASGLDNVPVELYPLKSEEDTPRRHTVWNEIKAGL